MNMRRQPFGRAFPFRGGRNGKARLLMAALLAAIALYTYYASTHREYNPITGETQRVALHEDEEIAMGLRAAPEMARRHGGLHADEEAVQHVRQLGASLVERTAVHETAYAFDFHLLADPETVNAFALPGGQVFITYALYRLLESDDEVAGVLGHEIGHVVARHSSEHIAQAKLSQGLTRAAILAASEEGGAAQTQIALLINQLVTTKYGRDDELESDRLGVRFLIKAGYQPEALIRVMEVLAASGGAGGPPEFFSTHPNPERRMDRIREAIRDYRNGRSPA